MLKVEDYESARRVLSSKDEFGPPTMINYIELLEAEADIDFTNLKKYFKSFLPFMHGQQHIDFRKLINRQFSKAEIKKWNTRIVEIINHRVSLIDKNKEYDLIVEIIDPLYMDFVEMLFGVNLPDRKQFIRQIEIATNSVERMASLSQLLKLQETLVELEKLVAVQLDTNNSEYLFNEVVLRVKNDLQDEQITSLLIVLLIAPRAMTETIAHIIVAFSHLDLDQGKKYSSENWVNEHIDDLIRLYASTNILSRETKKDLEINGCPVTMGSQVLIDIPTVNRDPNQYGLQVCLDQLTGNSRERKHLTFGSGPHICSGAELAKEIIREFVPRFFSKFSKVNCDCNNITYYKAQIATRIKNLSVQFR